MVGKPLFNSANDFLFTQQVDFGYGVDIAFVSDLADAVASLPLNFSRFEGGLYGQL